MMQCCDLLRLIVVQLSVISSCSWFSVSDQPVSLITAVTEQNATEIHVTIFHLTFYFKKTSIPVKERYDLFHREMIHVLSAGFFQTVKLGRLFSL